jgi:hypothetical protein
MQRQRHLPAGLAAAALALLALLGCAGSSSGGDAQPAAPTGVVAMSVSDASTEDWAVIGVKLLGITLTPQNGGTPVTIMTAPAIPPVLNLVSWTTSAICSATPRSRWAPTPRPPSPSPPAPAT